MSDPHIEISVDPGSGENSRIGGDFASRSNRFACRQGTEVLIPGDSSVELAQEFAAIPGVIFPGVFAIEKQANRQGLRGSHTFAKFAKPSVQIGGGVLTVHAAVYKSDEVGKMVVAKKPSNGFLTELDTQRPVQALRICRHTFRVAKESCVQSPAEYAFIRPKPLEALFRGNGQRLIGNRAFGRP